MATNKPVHLPDAMPDVSKPTLLVVCDTHHCQFIDVGNHTLVVNGTVKSKEPSFSDHEGSYQSPAARGMGGIMGGLSEPNKIEQNRLREFANDVCTHLAHVVQQQGIAEVYLSAPNKFLGVLDAHLTPALKKLVKTKLEGNFVKEPPRDTLIRFRPDLEQALKDLRDLEGYSARKLPPKKSK